MNSLPTKNLVAVVLAAGSSRRFGRLKQLEPIDGVPMVRRAVHSIAAAQPNAVVLVAGHEAGAVHAAANTGFLIVNDDYAAGLGSSIALATRTLAPAADGLVFCLADQPLIPREHYAALCAAWDGSPDGVIATAFDDSIGPPVLFGRNFFAALGALSGDAGAKRLLEAAGESLLTIPCAAAGIDIDRPGDLEQVDQVP